MDTTRHSLVDHLTDLRRAIINSLTALALATVGGYFLAPTVLAIIKAPLPVNNLVFFGPFDGLYLHIRLAILSGLILSSPVIAASLAWFISPGMTEQEKKALTVAGAAVLLLFSAGLLYGLKVVLPWLLSYLVTFSTAEMLPFVSGEEYYTFVLSFLTYSGLAFITPLVVYLLVYYGFFSACLINKYRKICLMLLLGLSMFFAPGGDLFTQALMALPLYLLFEAAVMLAKLVQYYKGKK